jgi:hypothetical protein
MEIFLQEGGETSEMAEQEAKAKIASLEDVLGGSVTEKAYIKSLGKSVIIKRLQWKDYIAIERYGKNKADSEKLVALVFRGLVEPKVTLEQIGEMFPDVIAEIADAIMKISTPKEEEIRPLSRSPKDTISG